MNFFKIIRRLQSEFYILFNQTCFGRLDRSCRIYSPLKIDGKLNIFVGKSVVIESKTWLAAVAIDDGVSPCLEIGDGSRIGHFNHIYATKKIKVGKNVLTADRVYISDNQHSYEDITTPIQHQPIKQVSEVEIGDGSWLGEGVCIIGSKIGKGCVIGANAVVTKDIPDYSVAVGIPAKVIKQYNFDTNKWEKSNQ